MKKRVNRRAGESAKRLTFMHDARGYTIVETLVASAILLSVLIPAVLFLGKITMSQYSRDLIVATQLARAEMESSTLLALYQDEEKEVEWSSKRWRVVKAVRAENGLIEIQLQVFKASAGKPVVTLKTLRVAS